MNFFDKLLGKNKKLAYVDVINNKVPAYINSFGNDIYASDLINNCIDRIASEVSKVKIKSVIENQNGTFEQKDDITMLFDTRPNPFQNSADFLRNVEWLRRKKGHAFILPTYEIIKFKGQKIKRYTGFFPLNYTYKEFFVTEKSEIYVKLRFGIEEMIFPYNEIIHLKWRRGINTIEGGGDDTGELENKDTLNTIKALDEIKQGIPKSITAALEMNGVILQKSIIGSDELRKKRDEFETDMVASKKGIYALDLSGEFTPINKQVPNVPTSMLDMLHEEIREKYGISKAILSGDYSGEQNAAFFQTCIEDSLNELEQEFKSKLFTDSDIKNGHTIKGYYSKIAYLSTMDKKELANLALNTRLMTRNEIREMFGMEPREDGNDTMQSLNFISGTIADQYQLKTKEKEGKNGVD